MILLVWGTIKFCCVVNAADWDTHNTAEMAAATLLLEAVMVPISRKLKNEVVSLDFGSSGAAKRAKDREAKSSSCRSHQPRAKATMIAEGSQRSVELLPLRQERFLH